MNGQFGFLPWIRQGLSNKINQTDNLGLTTAGTTERANVVIDVTLNTTIISNTVQMISPGDITGIDPSQIVKAEPTQGVLNFEENYMAFVEFKDADFPWRYTPAIPNSNNQLRPWLALIVLKNSEFTIQNPAANGLPQILNINASPAVATGALLHPQNQHWAWAHVQLNKPSLTMATLPAEIASDPNAAISRLICSRRLDVQTEYTAFLIPSFETGRKAGLGESTSSVNSLKASWGISATVAIDGTNNRYPIYYQWSFTTASAGDFETLVRKLQPREFPTTSGARKMDISNTGMGLNSSVTPGYTTVQMEGALKPPHFAPLSPQKLSVIGAPGNYYSAYTAAMRDLLNLSQIIQNTGFAGASNPYVPGKTFLSTGPANDDPIVLPPMYGAWHANATAIVPGTSDWFQEINLDPRYRAAAGLGSRVVRENKQSFMEKAWAQVGEVLLTNDRLRGTAFAVEASRAIYKKHLLANQDVAGVVDDDRINDTVKIAALAFDKIKMTGGQPTTTTSVNLNTRTARTVGSFGNITTAATDAGFRKIVRNRSKVVKKMNDLAGGISANYVNSKLISKLNGTAPATGIKAAQPLVNPFNKLPVPTGMPATTNNFIDHSIKPINVSPSSYSSPAIGSAGFPGAAMMTGSYSSILASGATYNTDFDGFKTTLGNLTTTYNAIVPQPVAITKANFVADVKNALNPDIAIKNRVIDSINLSYNGTAEVITDLKPIMAYPVINDVTSEYLMNISADYVLPNINQYPNNVVTILQSNNRFIESFLAGMNHEFAKELLWQQYPTDQRGSYFRRFWDIGDTQNLAPASAHYMYDVNLLHNWNMPLGSNNSSTRVGGTGAPYLVLLIRGDLLKKFPNTMIYAQKAGWPTGGSPTPHTLLNPLDSAGNLDPSKVKFPLFTVRLQPDVAMLGFDLNPATVIGSSAYGMGDAGWFFVFKERPGQVRFGLKTAVGSGGISGSSPAWANLSWPDLIVTPPGGMPKTASVDLPTSHAVTTYSASQPLKWRNDSNAAAIASILFRNPVNIAIHADDILS